MSDLAQNPCATKAFTRVDSPSLTESFAVCVCLGGANTLLWLGVTSTRPVETLE
jgi:hypothetical protein